MASKLIVWQPVKGMASYIYMFICFTYGLFSSS